MRIYKEFDFNDFEPWSGAVDTYNRICDEGKGRELEEILDDMYPDGMDETELNDLLWFESEAVYEWLGISDEEDDDNDEEYDEDETNPDNYDSFEDFCQECNRCPYYELDSSEECEKKFWQDKEIHTSIDISLLIGEGAA